MEARHVPKKNSLGIMCPYYIFNNKPFNGYDEYDVFLLLLDEYGRRSIR